MNRDQSLSRCVVAILLAVLGLVLAPTIPTANADPKPKIFPLDTSPYGNTYGEWTAQWWQWLMSIPEATNPNFDTSGAHCAVGQAGPVWFLAGSFGGSFTRACTVPAGKALLLTPLTQLNGAGAFDCEPTAPDPCNINALRALAAAFADSATALEVTVDGHTLKDVPAHRVQSPVFTLTYPEGAVFGLPSGTFTPNLSDGYWLLLAPLSTGSHTIRLKGTVGIFTVEVTWHLTVSP
jgi:hypothetical protein